MREPPLDSEVLGQHGNYIPDVYYFYDAQIKRNAILIAHDLIQAVQLHPDYPLTRICGIIGMNYRASSPIIIKLEEEGLITREVRKVGKHKPDTRGRRRTPVKLFNLTKMSIPWMLQIRSIFKAWEDTQIEATGLSTKYARARQ